MFQVSGESWSESISGSGSSSSGSGSLSSPPSRSMSVTRAFEPSSSTLRRIASWGWIESTGTPAEEASVSNTRTWLPWGTPPRRNEPDPSAVVARSVPWTRTVTPAPLWSGADTVLRELAPLDRLPPVPFTDTWPSTEAVPRGGAGLPGSVGLLLPPPPPQAAPSQRMKAKNGTAAYRARRKDRLDCMGNLLWMLTVEGSKG